MPGCAGAALSAETARLIASLSDGTALLATFYDPQDEMCFHLFDAASASLLERAAGEAGISFDRVVAVQTMPDAGKGAFDE
jgi:hypothetical protein